MSTQAQHREDVQFRVKNQASGHFCFQRRGSIDGADRRSSESQSHGVARGLAPVLSPYGQSHEDNLGHLIPRRQVSASRRFGIRLFGDRKLGGQGSPLGFKTPKHEMR
jgi:hypothetical protein